MQDTPMAQREREKSKRATERAGPAGGSAEARIVALEAELERAYTRIRELEANRNQVITRIDWVIDSLHNALEKHS
jgi:glycerate kinase